MRIRTSQESGASFSLVAAQNASRSAGARRTRKSQPWLKPALGARIASARQVSNVSSGDRSVRVVLAHHATAVNRVSQLHAAMLAARRPCHDCLMAQVRTLPPGYPVAWEADVVLRDGSVAHVRPITPDDADGLREFHAGQSEESIYMRFFAPLRELSNRDVERFTVVDYDQRVALVVTLRGHIIGIGRYDKVDRTTAEVAFNISDHYQGKGIGSVLLEHLSAIGHEAGLTRFIAEVLPRNRKMLNVFQEAGYHVEHRLEDGIVVVTFDITPTAQSTAVRIAREHRAEALSVRGILTPTSVAVVGASRREQLGRPDHVAQPARGRVHRHGVCREPGGHERARPAELPEPDGRARRGRPRHHLRARRQGARRRRGVLGQERTHHPGPCGELRRGR